MSAAEPRITKTTGICGGKACITGHRVRVMDIVGWHENRGLSPDEILVHYPSLSLSDVHAALAYYYDNLDEIRSEMEGERLAETKFREDHTSALAQRLSEGISRAS